MDSLPLILGFLGVGTALLTWLLVGQLIRLAPRIGLVDRPNERSSHTRVTPRGGGIGFVVAIALGVALWASLSGGRMAENAFRSAQGDGAAAEGEALVAALASSATEDGRSDMLDGSSLSVVGLLSSVIAPRQLFIILLSALFIAAISLRDDFRSLGAGLRFVCHFAAAGAVVWTLGAFAHLDLPLWGVVTWPTAAGVALTLVWIVGLTNVYNFMDGIDGIAGVQGVVAGLGWVFVGVAFEATTTAALAVFLVGGCAGFLVHNWSPAKIFMGDVGSAFLGFLFAVLPLIALHEAPDAAGSWPVVAVLTVWPFVGDGALTFVRRALKREKVWQAHRSHLYQRLNQAGWSHAPVSRLYAGWAVLTVAVAWLWASDVPGSGWGVWLVPLASLAGMFAYVSRREVRGVARAAQL